MPQMSMIPYNDIILVLVMLWILPWKAYALWLSARNEQKWWFVIMFLVNLFAILNIIYIFFISPKKTREQEAKTNKEPDITPPEEEQ